MFGAVRSLPIAVAPALALLAAGCGGGSSSVVMHPIDRIAASADTLLMGDVVTFTDREDIRIESRCSGVNCALSARGVELGEVSISGLTEESEGEWPAATETYRGVSLAGEAAVGAVGEPISEGSTWGGWLEHSLFLVGHATFVDDELVDVTIPFATSMGAATGTNPPLSPEAPPGRAS